ncbi:hypothetical protein [Brevibacillus thermoruber]|jgi:hypothetical protein|uniref:hypothetical protein n=1 Tax=Brevibacillus thermoruber TaxID=33942 RepID=UPI00048F237B|nr:hypothetical protein [Brevibacillus thermoruber]
MRAEGTGRLSSGFLCGAPRVLHLISPQDYPLVSPITNKRRLLYGALTHYLLAMFWDDYMFIQKLKVTGSGTQHTFDNVNENFWVIFCVEILLAVALMVLSFFIKKEPK